MNQLNPAYLALIPLIWCVLSFALSQLSGWSKLAVKYPPPPLPDGPPTGSGERASFRSGRIGAIHYYSCLGFRASEAGLLISMALPLRLGHPPLFIPWNEFHHVRDDPKLFSQSVCVSIGKPTVTRVLLPGWVKYHMPLELRGL